MPQVPAGPQTVDELEEFLSRPNECVREAMAELDGDLVILGVGGKMGPTLARMAQRATEEAGVSRRILGVSRFSSPDARANLERWGIETIACDLLNPQAVAALPDAALVVCMTGLKFGSSENPALTWAMNCYVPALVSERYRESRIAVFSSGNVYGMTPVESGGSIETDPLNPVGEYAITVMGRERMFEYFSRAHGIPMTLLRLNYATELRYGVLVDLANQVFSESTIDVSMGHFNVIWQTEANAMALASLRHTDSPPRIVNIAGSEICTVRSVCERLGELMGKPVRFTCTESPDALLNNARESYKRVGEPSVTMEQMLEWTADWISRGGASLNKPTHFESRDGRF